MFGDEQQIFKEREHIKHYSYRRYWKRVCVIDYRIRVELTYTINQPNLLTFIAL